MRQVTVFAATAIDTTTISLSFIPKVISYLFGPVRQRRVETMQDRIARVSRLTISPYKFVGYQGDAVSFSALPLDFADRTIQGVRFSWLSSDTEKVQIDQTGRATFLQPGLARIICRAGSVEASAFVLVRPGARPPQTDAEWRADQARLRADGTTPGGTTGSLWPRLIESLSPTVQAQSYYNFNEDIGYDEMTTEARNLVGSPRNRIADSSRLGTLLPESSSYNQAIPILGLGGRGIAANLTLFYNSRVWSRKSSTITFDAISGWPGPGFSFGFPRIVKYGTIGNYKYILVDSDGTRRYISPTTGYATDGSGVSYVVGGSVGTVYYSDGTVVSITLVNNRLLPTMIIDTNGNYIQIAYKQSCDEQQNCIYPPLAIDYVTDTLGRNIEFEYDSTGKLIEITTPGFGGTSQNPVTTSLVRFNYESRHPTGSFSGLTVQNTHDFDAIKLICHPTTGTGYKLTYGVYGMAHNVSLRRGMSVNPSGVISEGTESASVGYNYPTTSSSLTDAPSFTQRTESATNSPTGVYSYSKSEDQTGQTLTYTITRPDSSQVLLTRSTNGSIAANGLIVQSEVKSGSATFSKSVLTYGNDPGGRPQVQTVTSYDDSNTPVKADFDHDQYGNVTNRREYGHQISGQWQVRRRTKTTYKTDTAYINAYLRSLPTVAEVFDAQQDTTDSNDVLIAKSSFTYDDYQAMGGMENYGGTAEPPGHTGAGTSHTVRGNVTGTTRWIDVVANTSITHLKKYDIFGNVVKEEVSCCNERSYSRTEANYWSQAEEVTNGSGSTEPLTGTAEYDFNTGAAESKTDPNELTMSYIYDGAMRPSGATGPTGASASQSYNDSSLSSGSSVSYDDGGTNKTVGTSSQHDGWGQVIESVNEHGGQINTTYDAMGRVTSQTNPFPVGTQPTASTSYLYDALGRTTEVTLPDSNEITYTYDGNKVTVTDQVNRKIRRESDGLGRLVKVTEQDSSGSLTQETTYSYDLLDNLTDVNQGGQLRKYKYDALGRMLYEKIPEMTATISDGAGGSWTTKYVYNEFNAVTIKTDPRGVEKHFRYDDQHRVLEIWYTGLGGNESGTIRPALPSSIADTPDVNYSYNYNQSSKGTLSAITLVNSSGTVYQETFSYDSFERVSSRTWTRDNKSYTISYQYNEASQVKQITYPSNRKINVGYNNQGKLLSLVDNDLSANYLTTASYNHAGQMTGMTQGSGAIEAYTYGNSRMQMTRQTATKSGNTLMDLNYSYQASAGQMGAGTTAGNAGQLMSISNSTIGGTTESAAYTYDLQGRLVTSNQTTNGASFQRRYIYDRWGNRKEVWNATTGGTRIQNILLEEAGGAPTNRIDEAIIGPGQFAETYEYEYDEAGNVINDGVHTYQYDGENRIKGMDVGTSYAYFYAYDYQNRRLKKLSSATGAWTHYIWEGSQVIAEYSHTGALLTEYIQAGNRMIAKRASGVVRYFLSDRLSIRATLDASGNVVGRQGHLPFGEEIGTSGEFDKKRFTSYERDGESGLDYAVNRSHSPAVGRFLQADPYRASGYIVDPQSWNRYSYAHNDSVNRVDPLGLYDQPSNPPPASVPYETGCQMFPELCFPYVRPPIESGSQAPPPPPDCNPIVEVAQLPGQLSLSNNGFQFIRSFEAYRRHLYNDAAGNCTIGYGHLLHLGPCNNADRAQYPNGISRQDAEILLRSDVAIFENVVNNSVTVPLMQNQFDALVSFAFNVGGGAFQGSTLLQQLNQGNYNAVPSELLRWNRAGGRPLRGLTRRRQAEGDMFCSHYVPGYRPRF